MSLEYEQIGSLETEVIEPFVSGRSIGVSTRVGEERHSDPSLAIRSRPFFHSGATSEPRTTHH